MSVNGNIYIYIVCIYNKIAFEALERLSTWLE